MAASLAPQAVVRARWLPPSLATLAPPSSPVATFSAPTSPTRPMFVVVVNFTFTDARITAWSEGCVIHQCRQPRPRCCQSTFDDNIPLTMCRSSSTTSSTPLLTNLAQPHGSLTASRVLSPRPNHSTSVTSSTPSSTLMSRLPPSLSVLVTAFATLPADASTISCSTLLKLPCVGIP